MEIFWSWTSHENGFPKICWNHAETGFSALHSSFSLISPFPDDVGEERGCRI